MQCPKCNKDNQEDAKVCEFCNCAIAEDGQPKKKAKRKLNKWGIAGVVIAMFILSIVSTAMHSPILAIGAISVLISLGIKSYLEIKNDKENIRGKTLALIGIIVPVLLLPVLFLWSMDADEIPNDYTIDDLRSAPAEYNESYEILMSLSDDPDALGYSAIGFFEDDQKIINEISGIIKEKTKDQAVNASIDRPEDNLVFWEKAKKSREIIARLSNFVEIADMTEVKSIADSDDYDTRMFRNLRSMANIYQAYVYYEIEEGNEKAGIEKLIEFDRVSRKLKVNARSILTNLVCIAVLRQNMETANYILNNPSVSHESIGTLAGHFVPLNDLQKSFQNQIIFEYLIGKETLQTMPLEDDKIKGSDAMLKRNSAIRLLRNHYNTWLVHEGKLGIEKQAELTVWPRFCGRLPNARLTPDGKVAIIYHVYNPIGTMMAIIMLPAIDKVHEKNIKLQVRDDLLQIVINRRLGREVSLKARAYGDEYIVDIANKKILSPGPDGKVDTKDDIYLEINPEVLGWVETVN